MDRALLLELKMHPKSTATHRFVVFHKACVLAKERQNATFVRSCVLDSTCTTFATCTYVTRKVMLTVSP